jgi:hypothetical protein
MVIKIRSTPSFGWEVKPEVPCSEILRHVKNSITYLRHLQATFSLLCPFLLFVPPDISDGRIARELWWTSQKFSLSSSPWLSTLTYQPGDE